MEFNSIHLSLLLALLISLILLLAFFKFRKNNKVATKFITNKLHYETTLEITVETMIYFSLFIAIVNNYNFKPALIVILFIFALRGYLNE